MGIWVKSSHLQTLAMDYFLFFSFLFFKLLLCRHHSVDQWLSGPATTASPGNFTEMQLLRSHSGLHIRLSGGGGPLISFNKPPFSQDRLARFSKYILHGTYTEKILIVYLKFKFNWVCEDYQSAGLNVDACCHLWKQQTLPHQLNFCILFGNPPQFLSLDREHGKAICRSKGCVHCISKETPNHIILTEGSTDCPNVSIHEAAF